MLVLTITIGVVIAIGIASRICHTGSIWIDNYLGDALYAILFYLVLSLLWPSPTPTRKALITLVAMVIIETFQLTGFAWQMRHSDNVLLKAISIVLGTHFGAMDLVAYGVGIASIWGVDRGCERRQARLHHRRKTGSSDN